MKKILYAPLCLIFFGCLEEFPDYVDYTETFFENYRDVVWENTDWDSNDPGAAERYLTFYYTGGRILSYATYETCEDGSICLPNCQFVDLGYDGTYITYTITEPTTNDTFVLDVASDDNVSFQFVFSVGIASDTNAETLIRYMRNGIDVNGDTVDLSNEPITRYTRTTLTDPCTTLFD